MYCLCKCVLPPGDNPIAVNKYIYKECVQVTGSVHLKTYWCFTQTDRTLAHQPTTTLEIHPLMAKHHCSLRMFTATLQILHSQPQDIPQCNIKNMPLVLLVTLNVHLEELCSLQQCREVVFSHTGLTTVHEFYK